MLKQELVLNDYQQLMLRIASVSPYNAVHAVLIDPQFLNITQLQNKLSVLLEQLGLGIPVFTADQSKVQFLPFDKPIDIILCSTPLLTHLTSEMNQSFEDNQLPMRFFVIMQDSQHYFCLTYDHWIADAFSIIQFMKAIFPENQHNPGSSLRFSPEMQACFPVQWAFFYRYLGLIQNVMKYAQAYRLPLQNDSRETGCLLYSFPPPVLQSLLAQCKIKQIKLTDIFITVLAQVFGERTALERARVKRKWLKAKRNRILIGIISNIRASSRISLSSRFGVFLGFFSLSFKKPEAYSWEALAQKVASKTKRLKRKRKAEKSYWLFSLQNKWWDRCRTSRSQYRLFSKNVPIMIGISNMNLNDPSLSSTRWFEQYLRCSPAALVCPMVFSFTTLHNRMELSINYRKAYFSEKVASEINKIFLDKIDFILKE